MAARRVLALVMCLGVVGCGGSPPSASPTTQAGIVTASPALTLTPTAPATPAAATPAPTAKPKPKPPADITLGSIATVVTDDLRVRSLPEVSDASEKLAPLLQRGQDVFVVKGPVKGSGYSWYEVQPIGGSKADGPGPFGWVAVGDKTGEPWIKGGRFACPEKPTTFAAFDVLEPLAWVACFGRKSITFPARIGDPEATCGIDAGWDITGWLVSTCPQPRFIVYDPTSKESFYSVIPPGLDTSAFRPGPEEKDWIAVRVTGHFDHKTATSCKGVSYEDYAPVPMGRDEIVTWCRATFVITAIERRG